MKMTGLAILNAYNQSASFAYFYNRMKEELNALGVGLEQITNAEILTYIDSKGDILDSIKDKYDFVLYLDKDLYVAELLTKQGMRLFNTSEAIRLCDDKMLTHIVLANNGIDMPVTVSAPLNYIGSDSDCFLKNLVKQISFPMIAKENYGSLGKGIRLLNNWDELVSYEKEHKFVAHHYQEYIASSKGFDYRLILINGKVEAQMKRVNDNDFRSNISLGGHGEKAELPNSYIAMAEKAASIMKLDYCGIDLLSSPEGKPILCEVNSNAFLTEIEKISGKNLAKLYAEHILNSLTRQ